MRSLCLMVVLTGCLHAAIGPKTMQPGYFLGVGILHQADFFLPTRWDLIKLDVSRTAPLIHGGYLHGDADGKRFLALSGSITWFNLPDFEIELYPDAPLDMRERIPYWDVHASWWMVDPSLVFALSPGTILDMGFSFGIQSNRQKTPDRYAVSDPFNPYSSSPTVETEREIFPVGGAGVGFTWQTTPWLQLVLRGRIIVGRVSDGGSTHLIMNGINMGGAGGGTEYMKQVSLGVSLNLRAF